MVFETKGEFWVSTGTSPHIVHLAVNGETFVPLFRRIRINQIMNNQIIDFMMACGAVMAAFAVGGVCLVGMLVWLGGWNWKAPKQAK